ncbi:hypothetical protein P171DRAFT_504592, partial [Karstenula rhodostoma CBS 690.94]
GGGTTAAANGRAVGREGSTAARQHAAQEVVYEQAGAGGLVQCGSESRAAVGIRIQRARRRARGWTVDCGLWTVEEICGQHGARRGGGRGRGLVRLTVRDLITRWLHAARSPEPPRWSQMGRSWLREYRRALHGVHPLGLRAMPNWRRLTCCAPACEGGCWLLGARCWMLGVEADGTALDCTDCTRARTWASGTYTTPAIPPRTVRAYCRPSPTRRRERCGLSLCPWRALRCACACAWGHCCDAPSGPLAAAAGSTSSRQSPRHTAGAGVSSGGGEGTRPVPVIILGRGTQVGEGPSTTAWSDGPGLAHPSPFHTTTTHHTSPCWTRAAVFAASERSRIPARRPRCCAPRINPSAALTLTRLHGGPEHPS